MIAAADVVRPGDLRLRLVGAVIAIMCISLLGTLPVAAGVLAVVAAGTLLTRPDARIWHRLLHMEGFVLLLFVTLPFTLPGTPLVTLGPLTASQEGVWRALLIACKVSSCGLLLMVMLGDLEPVRLGSALRSLRVNERVARMFVLTVRYVGLIRDEARRLNEAMRARGFTPRSSWHTWRSYGNFIGMLLVRALLRAHRVEEAMLCRAYSGAFPLLPQPTPDARDWGRFAGVVGFGLAAVAMDRL